MKLHSMISPGAGLL